MMSLKPKIVYTNEPMGDVEVVADFLPAPAELTFREDDLKVALVQSKSSVPESQQDQACLPISKAVREQQKQLACGLVGGAPLKRPT